MTKIVFAFVFLLLTIKTYSQQQGYIVLIDADNDQPFYLRIGDTVYNSSGIGHLMIPHLRDSTYTMMINFPKNTSRDYKFTVKINKKDLGFQLRNMGEKGWALFNWQTNELKMPSADSGPVQSIAERGTKRNDAFSVLMSSVVNDTSVMYNAFVDDMPSKDLPKTDSLRKIDSIGMAGDKNKKAMDSAAIKTTMGSSKGKIAKGTLSYPYIKKLDERTLKTSRRITYLDALQRGSVDTIIIFIPLEKEPLGDSTNPILKQTKSTDSIGVPATVIDNKKKNAVTFLECKTQASDYDVDVLKVTILEDSIQKKKIASIKKFLETKCLSVNQVKVLTDLFQGDKNKYEFFETAYPFVSDRDNFGQLAALLTRDEYIKRFRKNF